MSMFSCFQLMDTASQQNDLPNNVLLIGVIDCENSN